MGHVVKGDGMVTRDGSVNGGDLLGNRSVFMLHGAEEPSEQESEDPYER